ncbi:MAG: helix-hairpin-helix domain-containing protein [Thermoplasmata archaeon]
MGEGTGPSNAEVAEILRSVADLLDLRGEAYKPEAYRRAARSIETLPEPLAAVVRRGGLRQVPGVGEAIAEKVTEILRDGRLAYQERLLAEIPPGVIELLRRPGVGPKTARRLWVEFGIDSPASLREAIDRGRLAGARGWGERAIARLREAAGGAGPVGRRPIEEVLPVAQRLLAAVRAGLAPEERAELAGSLRRFRESVGDVDLVVGSPRAGAIFDRAAADPMVAQVLLRGETKMTVILRGGLQVDLRVVPPESFGAALQYFTGSKDHNVRLRSAARALGLKLNEYGVYRDDRPVAGRAEADVYGALGLSWIPPELREDRGEIDLAATDSLPPLVEARELRGELHWHPGEAAGPDEVDRVLAEARRRRLDYVGVVVRGADADGRPVRLAPGARERLAERGRRRRPGEAAVWFAEEVGPDGLGAPLPEGIDYRLLRPAGDPPEGEGAGRSPAAVWALVHGTGASALGAGDAPAPRRWLGWAERRGIGAEIGPGEDRIGPEAARGIPGLRLVVATAIDRPPDDPLAAVSLGFARRAGATAERVVNAAPGGRLAVLRGRDLPAGQAATMRSSARRARAATDGSTSMR